MSLRVSCQDAQLKKTIRANKGNVYHNPYVGSGATDSSPHSLTAFPDLEPQNLLGGLWGKLFDC